MNKLNFQMNSKKHKLASHYSFQMLRITFIIFLDLTLKKIIFW